MQPTTQGARKGADFTLNLDLCASLVAQTLDDTPNAPQEIYKAIRLGYEGDSKIPLSFFLDSAPAKAKSGKFKDKAVAIAPAFKQALKRKNPAGNLLAFIKLNEIELYWPYWQEWDGKELPTISFTPANSTTEGIGYKLIRSGNKYKLERVAVNDDYAFAHPTWILQEHVPVDAKDLLSGRFLPNYIIPGDKPEPVFYSGSGARKGVGTPGGVRANDEQLPDDGTGGGGDYDPGYAYGGGTPSPGPGLVEVPTGNGSADINQIFIYEARTDGTNFRDIFSNGENVMYFHRGDGSTPSSGTTGDKLTSVTIDRWAGRKGVWRTVNRVWDENWDALDKTQYLSVETEDSGVDQEFTIGGSAKLLYKVSGSVSFDDKRKISQGDETGFEVTPLSFSYKKSYRNQVSRNQPEDRRQFFAFNSGDAEGLGTQNGLAVRGSIDTHRTHVFFTMKVRSFNYANGY